MKTLAAALLCSLFATGACTVKHGDGSLGAAYTGDLDDLRVSNPAGNEKLFVALEDHLIRNEFDLKALMRSILISQTYRRSSEALPENEHDPRYYSRYYPRRLSAEVLSEAISDVTCVRDQYYEILLNDGSTANT
jgi:hypothetical protein